MGKEEEWALKRVGKKSEFNYPEGRLTGTLVDRSALFIPSSTSSPGLTDYIDVVDLIEYDGPKGKFGAIRFGYYRKTPKGKWIWGSQTTLTEEIEALTKLFSKARREKPWFKEFLEKVSY